MATRYAVATGNFSSTTVWSATSGGTPGASAPVTGDNVFMDAASGNITVTLTADAVMTNFDATGFTGTLNFGGFRFTVDGTACTFSSGMTLAGTLLALTTGTATLTLTSAGKQLPGAITITGSGGLTLADAVSVTGSFNPNGNLTTNNFSVTCQSFNGNVTTTRVYSFGSSSISVTGGGGTQWLTATVTGLTISANTAVVTFSGSSVTLSTGSTNFNGMSWSFTGSGAATVSLGTTVAGLANFTRTGTAVKTDSVNFSGTLTLSGTFTVNGNSAVNRVLVQSSAVGTSRTITAATVSVSNTDFMDITGAGAASWNLSAATGGSGDAGGNSGITFTTGQTNYWRSNGGNWSDSTHWSLTSGGGATGRVPLPQDSVRFDTNSFTAASQSVTTDMPRIGKDIDWTGVTNAPMVVGGGLVMGSLTFSSGMIAFNTGGSAIWTLAGRGSHTLTYAGRSFGNSLTVQAPGGAYTLQDAFNSTVNITLNNGTLDTNGMSVSCLSFTSTGTATRALTLGTSTVSLTSTSNTTVWNVVATGLTLSAASSTIVISAASASARTFAGGSALVYGTLTYTVAASTGQLTSANGCTITTVNVSGGTRTLTLPSGGFTTVTNWNVFGTVGAVVTINATSAGSAATISKASNTPLFASDYVSVQDITGTGGATFYMGSRSTNVSGNTGLSFADAPQRFWVGGTATWDATVGTKWAVVSGGTGGLAVPTSADDVYLDATAGSVSITLTTGITMRNFDSTGFTGTVAGSGFTLNVAGVVVVLGATATYTNVSLSKLQSTATTITTNGKILSNVTVNGTGSLTLLDAFTISGALTHTQGTLATNNFSVTCGSFSSSNSNTRTLTLGSSAITITGSTNSAWSTATTTGLTVTANTSTVTFSGGSGAGFSSGSFNFNGMSLVFSGSGSHVLATTTSTFANLTRTGTATRDDALLLAAGVVITGTFTASGNSTINRIRIFSNTTGTSRTITAGAVSASNVDFMDITGAGAANWNLSAITGGSGDAGGNSGITFTTAATQTWQGTAGGNWSDVTKWTSRVPLPQDNVVIASAFVAGQTVTSDMPRLGADVNWTGATGSPTWGVSLSSGMTIYGSMTLISGMTVNGGQTLAFGGRGSHTITMAGKAFTSTGTSVSFVGPGGTYTLQDAMSMPGVLAQNDGTLNTNGMAVTCTQVASTSGRTRALTLGTSTVSLTGTGTITVWNVTATGMTFSGASATIVITTAGGSTRSWAGGGFTYGTLTYTITGSVGRLNLLDSDTFGTLNFSDASATRILALSNGKTITVTNWNVFGRAGALITLQSTNAGFSTTLAKGDSILSGSDYLSIQDITASPGSTWYAGTHSVDVSGNTGWIFTDPPITGNASLSLVAVATPTAPVASSAALSLAAATATLTAPASATAALTLTGTGTAKVPSSGTAAVVLTATGTARTPVTGNASVVLTATATAKASVTSSAAVLITAATATARAATSSAALVVLAAVSTGTTSASLASAYLQLVASVVTGYLGTRDIQVSVGLAYDKFTSGVPVNKFVTGVPSI